jgi:tetratricopeptide (TPR) repeat protein
MKNALLYSLLLISIVASAQKQEKDTYLPKANQAFAEKNYSEAEAQYRLSKSKYPTKSAAAYNLGNTIYKINKPAEAHTAYSNAIKNAKTYAEKHRAFHNLGNVYMKQKNYTTAVEAYKNALINNPNDEETRYNYALAKKFLKENPPPKEDKKKKEDKKEDKDSKDKAQKQPEKGKDDKKDGDGDKKKDNPDKGQQDPQPGNGISKQRLENLLQAVNNEERKVQEKVNKRRAQGKPVKTEKDW